jgi:CelD/BcsL family acetyltransferase involved in cellulose biosynthesis
MALSWSIVSDLRQLEELAGPWSELLARSGANGPMLSPTWLLPWWRSFGGEGGRELRVGVLHRGDELAGLVPLLARWHWYALGIPFRRLELLGTGEPERDEICSEYLNVIIERGAEEEVTASLADALVRGVFGAWDELVLGALDGASELPSRLAAELRRRDTRPTLEETDVARYIPLPATWEAYLDDLPATSRYLVSRSLRDFESWAGDDVTIHQATSPRELLEGRRVLLALHESRWGDGGAFASPRFDAFHEQVMPALLESDALDLSWICAHGEPVAALYNVRWQGRIYCYQSGRRLDLPRAIRPGIVMHAHAIRRAIEGGMREYDFLGGTSQYKRKLAPTTRPLVRLRAVRRRLRETARVVAEGMTAAARMGRAMARERKITEESPPPPSSAVGVESSR